mmetsp:Transcript_127956/g.356099  ORF Transcript_127956/g.356099 Transcript_127956/m.356099 type:complete len:137 (+) Transcript_127956:274-684(+)
MTAISQICFRVDIVSKVQAPKSIFERHKGARRMGLSALRASANAAAKLLIIESTQNKMGGRRVDSGIHGQSWRSLHGAWLALSRRRCKAQIAKDPFFPASHSFRHLTSQLQRLPPIVLSLDRRTPTGASIKTREIE